MDHSHITTMLREFNDHYDRAVRPLLEMQSRLPKLPPLPAAEPMPSLDDLLRRHSAPAININIYVNQVTAND